jgi:hypothetical protein
MARRGARRWSAFLTFRTAPRNQRFGHLGADGGRHEQ